MLTFFGMPGALVGEFLTGLFASSIVKESRVAPFEQGERQPGLPGGVGGIMRMQDGPPPMLPLAVAEPVPVVERDRTLIGGSEHGVDPQDPTAAHLALWDMLSRSDPVLILDFVADHDQITLHYDPERIMLPEVSVTAHPGGTGTAEIRLNAHIIAFVANAVSLRAEDIVLIADHPCHDAAEGSKIRYLAD